MNLPRPIKFKVERYVGGLSRFKKIENPIKLSANESALGASPKAIEAFEKEKNKLFKYPEDDSNSLREVLSNKFKICLLYTSPSPRDGLLSRMPSSA